MKKQKWIRNLVLAVLLTLVCAGTLILFQGFLSFRKALRREPLHQKLEALRREPGYTKLEELPKIYLSAVIAAEDHRFYQHPGVDLRAVGRALVHDLRTMSLAEGGSTITQQLARNLYFTQEKKLSRKAAELWMAFYLEFVCTKEEILELYVNICYFGDGYYGIGQASRGYFHKEPGKLDDREATLLAGLPNAPSAYAPTKNPDLAVQRQRQVLEKMVQYGYLKEEETEALLYVPGQ